jgi:hypothetical protein
MEELRLNENVVRIARGLLPEGMSMVGFLSKTLGLSRGTAYRRIRGDIPFSVEEIYLIAQQVGVSMDFLVGVENRNFNRFELSLLRFGYGEQDSAGRSRIAGRFEEILGCVLAEGPSRFELSYNLFPQVPAHSYYSLSRYFSLKWQFRVRGHGQVSYKEINYPRSLFEAHRANSLATQLFTQTSYIWDFTIVETLVREIRYFADMKVLDAEDVQILKGELFEFLDFVEELTLRGAFPNGNRVNIYISSVNSDAAYGYMESPCLRICFIGVFDLQYVLSTDRQAFEITKSKIFSLRRDATLITRSNEIFRVSFFDRQRSLVDSL